MTGTADVPAEAVQAIARAYLAWSAGAGNSLGALPIYEEDVRTMLERAAEAGWVLVPGVRTEWGVRYGSHPDAVAPRRDERHARETAAQDGALEAAESRQVTGWRPAESTQDGDSR
jgi:hypothetical protein